MHTGSSCCGRVDPVPHRNSRSNDYFEISLDRSGFVAYIIEPRDEEAQNALQNGAQRPQEKRSLSRTNFPFALTKSVEGCTLNSVIRPGGRREYALVGKRAILLLRVRDCSLEESDLFWDAGHSSLPLNLHNRIDEEVCRIAWVNEASTDTCAFDLSLSDTKSQISATYSRSQVCPRSFLCFPGLNSFGRSWWEDGVRVGCERV